MLKNYFKIALRNIKKYKAYSLINILGLSIGIASSAFIYIWVIDELNYDRYNENVESIFRVEQNQLLSGKQYHINVTPYPSAPVFKEKIPEIIEAARFDYANLLLTYKDKSIYESSVVGIDKAYLRMFTLEFIDGDISTALENKFSIIINDEIANKYFGNERPIGKVLKINNEYDFLVTGVFKKLPENVTTNFEIAFPFDFFKDLGEYRDTWNLNNIRTFLQLHKSSDINTVEQKLIKIDRENTQSKTTEYVLNPLKNLHLYSQFGFEKKMGRIQYVYIFSMLALFISLIASINFMNLSTARSSKRGKEIGLRKVVGAERSGLISQFYLESIFLSLLAMCLSLIFILVLFNSFNQVTGKELSWEILLRREIIFGILGITFFTGIFAGSYPAIYLSSLKPISVLRGSKNKQSQKFSLRTILVIVQFSLSIILIIATIVVYNQMIFMKEKDLGYDKENLIYVYMRGEIPEKYEIIKSELLRTNRVRNVSGTLNPPHRITANGGGANWEGKNPDEQILIGANFVGYDYCKTMGINLVAGRDYSQDFSGDLVSNSDSIGGFLVNEEVVRIMGLDANSAIGAQFDNFGCYGKIVGVMKNFHFKDVKTIIEPIAFALVPDNLRFIVIRIERGNIPETIKNLTNAWASIVPKYPFEYRFLDDDLDRTYLSEMRMLDLLRIFSVIAILIACLGLFGLASFSAEQRTKEIGIRKTIGASVSNIVFLLSKEFIKWVLIANVIAWPISYILLNNWLQNYAYRVSIAWWVFLIATILTIIIAIITVGFQSIKAAIANPVNSLKYE